MSPINKNNTSWIASAGRILLLGMLTVSQVTNASASGPGSPQNVPNVGNMSLEDLHAAVAMTRGYPEARLEASGGLRLESARAVAEAGVDFVSIGALTHSSPALDLGLDIPAR